MRDYEFADPAIVRAVYAEDSPFETRDMLLEGRFHGLRFHFGVRVGGLVDEETAVDGRPVRRWGWNYRTLQGHLEMGQMDYEVRKWLDSGEVEFRIHAFSRPAHIPNRSSGSASVFGRRVQRRFARHACLRMARLTAARPRRASSGGPSGDKPVTWRFPRKPLCRNDFGQPRVVASGVPPGVGSNPELHPCHLSTGCGKLRSSGVRTNGRESSSSHAAASRTSTCTPSTRCSARAARVDDLFAEAARMGMPALAMTDHGQLFGAVDFYLAGQKHGVKSIIGTEAYLAPGSRFEKQRRDVAEPYSHLTLLAENQTGYGNLLRLVSAASLEGYFYKPRMDRELFEHYGEGLIATSGCPRLRGQPAAAQGRPQGRGRHLAEFRDLFGPGNYFVELHEHGLPEQRRVNPELIALARDLGLPLLAANDLHYTHKGDAPAHEVLLCIQTGAVLADPKGSVRGRGVLPQVPGRDARAVRRPSRRLRQHRRWPSAATWSSARRQPPPHFDVPDGHTLESWLRAEVERGAAERYGDPLPPDARDRIDFELQVINQLGFAGYFLIVADLCRHAR